MRYLSAQPMTKKEEHNKITKNTVTQSSSETLCQCHPWLQQLAWLGLAGVVLKKWEMLYLLLALPPPKKNDMMFLFPAVSERRVTEFDWLSTLSQRPLPTIISQTKQYKSVPNLTKFSGFIAQHKFKRLSSSYIVISISMTFFQFPKTSADKTVRLCWPFVWLCLWDLAKEVAWVAPDHLKPLHIQNIRFYNMLSLTYSCGCEMLQPRRAASSYPSVTFNRCADWEPQAQMEAPWAKVLEKSIVVDHGSSSLAWRMH